VTLFDATGRGVLTIHGAEMRPLEREARPEEALYSLEWQKVAAESAPSAEVRTWILIGGPEETAEELRRALERKGGVVLRCTAEQVLAGTVPTAAAEAVWLATLELSAGSGLSEAEKILAEGAALTAALAEHGAAGIRVVTRGTQAVAGERVENVLSAGAWGMFAAMAQEYPAVPLGCIDLAGDSRDEEMDLVAAALQGSSESRIAIRGDSLYKARLVPWAAEGGERIGVGDLRADEGFEVQQGTAGSLGSLELRTVPADAPGADEVEIAVEAAGLNFLDVLRAMGINEALTSAHFGGECAGTVMRVGAEVRGLRPGDSVLAISPSFRHAGMLASRVRVPEALVARKPEGMSFAEAAGIPCVFLTAWYGLVKLARLEKGEAVLIHAGAGGVGLAAIQIARWLGAEVWATAGSEEKRAYLRQLGVRHVMDSRTLDFSREILAETGGRGVDVVLNSLAGAAIPAGIEALAPYGRFVEIGKRDLWENSRLAMRPFLRNLSFFAVDLADAVESRRAMVGELLGEVMERFAAGDFSAEPTTVFPVSAAGEAFQHLARAAHIGKVVLEIGDAKADVRRSADRLHADATYLITGGLGGVGLQMAEALVRNGARHLVLTGRRAASGSALEMIARLEEQGAAVEVRRADVSDARAVRALLEGIGGGSRSLRGIVHAAGVLDDGVAANLSEEKFHRVMAGKVAGALAIDAVVDPGQLDFLVYASSAAGVLGSAGQANYAAANAMLDALAHRQRTRKIPAVSIDWGTWSEVGLAAAEENRGARLETHGMTPLRPAFGQALLMKVLGGMPAQVAAMILDADRWCASWAPAARSGLLDSLRRSTGAGARSDGDGGAEFETAEGEELRGRLVAWLRQQVAAVLRLDSERVPEDKAVRSLGLDSLMALELRNRLERQLHMKLSATLVWNYPTVAKLAEFLQKRLEEDRQTGRSAERPAQHSQAEAAEEAPSASAETLSASELLEAEMLEAEALLNMQAGAR
jgi:NADPH:quinone reductase-like Zn-dependent oxidoreductase/NAD(P)-dependent dehydrogenase (short-subunit alcohol dehydrogenase family)/acyl carrier protein